MGAGGRKKRDGAAGIVRPFAFALCATAALAQPAPPPAGGLGPPPLKNEFETRQMELRGVEDTMRASAEQRRQIEAELEGMRNDRARLNAALIGTAAKVQKSETAIAALETKLADSIRTEAAIQKSLESRRAIIAEILAGLQRMGRRPPPALLISPGDILKAMRTAMMLGGVVPELRAETEVLLGDLEELGAVRKRIGEEKEALSAELVTFGGERVRLAALVDARQKAMLDVERALEAERRRAGELARQATTLKDLIASMEKEIGSARRGAEAAKKADEERLKTAALPHAPLQSPFGDRSRTAPAIAFADAKGLLPVPVSGEMARKYGEKDNFGGIERGVSFMTRPGAAVSAPGDGWVSFAGPYRNFGQLLIINAGSGYYMVLAGMERISVETGQFVQAGEPVAQMGDGAARSAAAIAIGATQPILYVEFRKDGSAIDPGPWWSKPEQEKVRG